MMMMMITAAASASHAQIGRPRNSVGMASELLDSLGFGVTGAAVVGTGIVGTGTGGVGTGGVGRVGSIAWVEIT